MRCVKRGSMYKGVVCFQVVCREGVSKGCVRECVQRCGVFTSGVCERECVLRG